MNGKRYIPADILKPYISTFMIIESEAEMRNRVLPDTALVMAFRFRGEVTYTEAGIQNSLPLSVFSGLRKVTRTMNYAKDASTFLIHFREGGATAFFKNPLHELFGASVSLDTFFARSEIIELEERLATAAHHTQRVAIVEQFLISKLRYIRPEPLIQKAIEQIKQAGGTMNIQELAGTLCINQDSFEKKFRNSVGASPKRFSSIVRFRNIIKLYSPGEELTALAYKAGYFDQSHFIKDFRAFTGQTPHDFFKSSSYW